MLRKKASRHPEDAAGLFCHVRASGEPVRQSRKASLGVLRILRASSFGRVKHKARG
jgi:hypothetical protein